MDETIDKLKAGKRRPGVEEILIPGERSSRKAAENEAAGVPVGDVVVAEIKELCSRLNVPFDLIEVGS